MTSAYTLVQFEHEMMKERLKAKRTLQIIAGKKLAWPVLQVGIQGNNLVC